MALTPEENAALDAEGQALIAELKRRYTDRGIAGVPNTSSSTGGVASVRKNPRARRNSANSSAK